MNEFFIEITSAWWGILILSLIGFAIFLLIVTLFYKQFFKRVFDIILSLIFMVFFLIILMFVAIAIKIDDGGPIFYTANRLGKKCKHFKIFKFRSMKVNAPDIRLSDGSTFNSENDPRVTRVGKFLRKTSLDEIPQILNVFLGQMSFIGPRPDIVDILDKYDEKEKKRFEVRPGITGYNQAYYRNSIAWKEKVQKDIYYASNISLWFDIKIFFKTIIAVFFRKNIYVVENVPVQETTVDISDGDKKNENTEGVMGKD